MLMCMQGCHSQAVFFPWGKALNTVICAYVVLWRVYNFPSLCESHARIGVSKLLQCQMSLFLCVLCFLH